MNETQNSNVGTDLQVCPPQAGGNLGPFCHPEGVKRLKNLGGRAEETFEILRYAQNDKKGAQR